MHSESTSDAFDANVTGAIDESIEVRRKGNGSWVVVAEEPTKKSIRSILTGFHFSKKVVVIGVLAAAIIASSTGIAAARWKKDKLDEEYKGHLCVKGEADELKDARIELHLEGLSTQATSNEQNIFESALMESYNQVSAGCDDIYERWMYQANLVNFTVIQNSSAVAVIETTISCHDCPDDEVFASIYPTDVNRRLSSRSSGRVRGSAPTVIRTLQDSTIDAADIISLTEQRLIDANLISSIPTVRVQNPDAQYLVLYHSSKKSSKKKSSKKSGFECAENGKGSKKTPMPTESSMPSTSGMPSSMPSISVMPTSTSKKTKKTESPSISQEPSAVPSGAPSCTSFMPSSEPSFMPSSEPSFMPSSEPTS